MKGGKNMLFKGSGVALVTPFDKNNNINYEKVEELIEFHIANNTDAIIICGTTGESSTLSTEEKKELIKFSVKVANKRIPIIAGTGSNNTKNATKMSIYAEEIGVDGLLIVTPYYNKCTQESLYMHYKTISDNVNIPIILYNVPSRTSVDINVDTIVKLSKIKNICGIKEANTDISKIANIISKTSDDFYVYSGNDDLVLPILSLGGAGVISVIANIIPTQIHDICSMIENNEYEKAKKIYYRYLDLMKYAFIEVNPIPIKFLMNELLFNVGSLRLPLAEISEKNKKLLKKVLPKVL